MCEGGELALAYRSIRVLRWIDFSEGDGKGSRPAVTGPTR